MRRSLFIPRSLALRILCVLEALLAGLALIVPGAALAAGLGAAALGALLLSVIGDRPGLAPTPGAPAPATVRAIVEDYGVDSLSPFVLRPDKQALIAGGGLAAYRRFADTLVVSGDPIGPAGCEPAVIDALLHTARRQRLSVAIYGASARHLDAYRRAGLRTLCVGEEAVVDPARFTLEGRPVRKLRQSVQRLAARGWSITAVDGREIDPTLEAEIDAVETAWQADQPRVLGFAMSMGEHERGVAPTDLFLLGRSPTGELQAVMRFFTHCGNLTLDTMRRVGETPNGLNEALVCRALSVARERDIREVSLNYAGLGHLVRRPEAGPRLLRPVRRALLGALSRRFQMERLVRFNAKFSPDWRPRYLVYPSRRTLALTAYRVLQAEGYRPAPRADAASRRAVAAEPMARPAGGRIDLSVGR